MNIIVCVKIVQGEINPFDGAALETALRLDDAQTTVLCMGPKNVLPILESLTRLGDFRTILVSDELYAGSDTLATSHVLSRAIRQLEPELVFCGRQSIDGETAQVGPSLSAWLGYELVASIMEFGVEKCLTRDGWKNVLRPGVLTFERICDLRFPSIRSRRKDVEIWGQTRVGAKPELCGLAGSPTRVLKTFESNRGRRTCRLIPGEELEPLLERLRRQPSPRPDDANSSDKVTERFGEIWIVGENLLPIACRLAENIVALKQDTTEKLLEKIIRGRPEIVLWESDSWGRSTAPQVAASLRTGLCADCTRLEISREKDGLILEMFRPALGGNVLAQIRCRTRPIMATVRTPRHSGKIVVGCGRGIADHFSDVERFAGRWEAELCASRALVDLGVAPYEMQVGLTGKHVAPQIYVAIGISGTVQHLCAVESAGTIIAINPDRHARIFDYADYGIVDRFENTFRQN